MTTDIITATSVLTVPKITADDSTLDAAIAYAAAGWYVGPAKVGTKHPGSRLGSNWQTLTSRDPEVITGWFAGSDDGIYLHCGRSGAVVFDVDHPEKIPPELTTAVLDTGPPFQETRTGETGRGHFVFAFPEGRTFGNGTGKLGGAWGEVRGMNGVIIVAPSVHADGGTYTWGTTGTVPTLPAVLADALPDAREAVDAATDAQVEAFLGRDWTGPSRPDLGDIHHASLSKKIEAGESRHESAVGAVIGTCKDAAAGLIDPGSIIENLQSLFLNAATKAGHGKQGKARGLPQARNEWAGIVSWAVAQALVMDIDEHLERVNKMFDPARQFDGIINGHIETPAEVDIEEAFWASDIALTTIRDYALARLVSPWAVLGAVLVNVAHTIPPGVMLPPTVGVRASLNTFVALVGSSGTGKGLACGVAAEVVNVGEDIQPETPGSGEGLAACFVHREKDILIQHATAVVFDLPEIDTLAALTARSGTTLDTMLRQLWSGEKLGFAYRDQSKKLDVQKNTYRAGLTAGVQPERAGALFAGADGGTPQRFLWMPATDPRIGRVVPDLPDPVRLDRQDWPRELTLTIPDEAAHAVREAASARARGEGDALDGHALLARLKVAQLLTVLVGRRVMTSEDWERSAVVMARSDRTRNAAQKVIAEQDEHRTRAAGRHDAIRSEAATEITTENAIKRVAQSVRRHVTDEGISRSNLRKTLAGRDREFFDDALDRLVGSGDINVVDTGQGQRVERAGGRST